MTSNISRDRRIAVTLALVGALTPTPFPLAGLHKFYLGQPGWGTLYLILGWTQISRIACAIEAVWYLTQPESAFQARVAAKVNPAALGAGQTDVAAPALTLQLATALRELEHLRQEGLISEYEFESQRRTLLDHTYR
ncbi:hypothetical protein XM38_007420 [Halomicronema hongdechloris C2206]|uniref:Uncharacterized protein n=1 Tax=Halomicronema hongdechloris C2206 TaxID=1641165 RepID=A0A1Z3HHS0_9CYAN|nr:NINE protein [Halomicronema hongdechloris]ASC69813.1 hypothetical protein XM38_007420 [Halomicronema hongdechloris C2206]